MRKHARMEQETPWEGVSAAAASAGLYAEHEIKEDMVIGPELLQPPDVAFTLQAKKSQLDSVECSDAETGSFVVKPGPGTYTSTESLEEKLKEPAANICGEQLMNRDKQEQQIIDKEQDSGMASQHIHNAEEINPRMEMSYKENIHTEKKPIQSGSKQLEKQYLTRHQRSHLAKICYSCTSCKKQFTDKSNLLNHMQNHKEQELYSCDICNKQFSTSHSLRNHMQMHGGDTPYSCDICEKQFPHKSYLSIHKRNHVLDKPYSCDVCQKQFLYKNQLSSHKKIHTKEKPYSCGNCKKQFANNTYFIKHVWNCKI